MSTKIKLSFIIGSEDVSFFNIQIGKISGDIYLFGYIGPTASIRTFNIRMKETDSTLQWNKVSAYRISTQSPIIDDNESFIYQIQNCKFKVLFTIKFIIFDTFYLM